MKHALLNNIKKAINDLRVTVVVRVGLFRSLWYGFVSRAFRAEFASVARGISNYRRNVLPTEAGLRRNIHRIEKGLSTIPRKPYFAENYIGQTVDKYNRLREQEHCESIDRSELKWAHDVLHRYFEVVESSRCINDARARFLVETNCGTDSFIPFPSKNRQISSISYEQFLILSKQRRSIRWFLDRPVDRTDVDRAIIAAIQAPSACNRQSFHYYIFDKPTEIRNIVELSIGMRGFGEHVPALVVLTGRLAAYDNERDRHVIYIDASLSAMAFMYALETLGLSSCPINWPGLEGMNKKLGRLLHLADDECTIMLIAFGYPDPDGLIPYSEKRALDAMRSYNK